LILIMVVVVFSLFSLSPYFSFTHLVIYSPTPIHLIGSYAHYPFLFSKSNTQH